MLKHERNLIFQLVGVVMWFIIVLSHIIFWLYCKTAPHFCMIFQNRCRAATSNLSQSLRSSAIFLLPKLNFEVKQTLLIHKLSNAAWQVSSVVYCCNPHGSVFWLKAFEELQALTNKSFTGLLSEGHPIQWALTSVLPPRTLCFFPPSVCLLVYQQDYVKTTQWILIKLGGRMGVGPRKNPLNDSVWKRQSLLLWVRSGVQPGKVDSVSQVNIQKQTTIPSHRRVSNQALHYISFSWRFYPKRLTISAFNHEGTNPEQQESRKYNFFKRAKLQSAI